MLNIKNIMLTSVLIFSCFSGTTWAKNSVTYDLLRDAQRPGMQVEIDEDQHEVYAAVRQGLIRPFSELYTTVENELYGRIIKVELEEDDDQWVYELKLIHDNKVIKVEYNATTLELMSLRGYNLLSVIKK